MVHLTTTNHANAVNLARRLSVQNEADLLQEPFYETEEDTQKFSHDFCAELAKHLIHTKSLPSHCKQYSDVVLDLKKRDRDTTKPDQFLS